jgi:outer membrane protein assembly factor BamB
MNDYPFGRRDILKLTAGSVIGADGVFESVDSESTSEGEEIWRLQTGGSGESSPTVDEARVFVGSNDNHIYARNAGDGQEFWMVSYGTRVESSPMVVNELLFHGSADGNVYALLATDPIQNWKFQTGGRVESSPTVADGRVFVGSNERVENQPTARKC